METAGLEYIISTVFKTNILPVISECNTNCIFCSHKQNPKEVQVFRMPKLNLKDFEEIIEFLSPNKKIVIGEAATRIIEGEPFLYKDIIKLIQLIRQKFPFTPIQITTNGLLLEDGIIEKLVEIENVELNISVNCVNSTKHKVILGLKTEQNIKDKLRLVSGKLKFSGSCVLVREIMDWKDVEEICAFLDEVEAESMRLFIPGYTKLSKGSSDFFEVYDNAKGFIDSVRRKYSIPIIIEPSVINELDCRVEGIIKDSPADMSGIKVGDLIKEVNGKPVESRVDGFDKAFRGFNPKLKVIRANEIIDISLLKPKNSSPGFVVLFDIDPNISNLIKNVVRRNSADKVLFITSELAYNVIAKAFKNSNFEFEYKIISDPNRYLGGTIKCAGLLTVEDVLGSVQEYLKTNSIPDLIVLPPIMFDAKRKDLLGRSLGEIENILQIKVDIP